MAFKRLNLTKRERLSSSGSALSEDSDIFDAIEDDTFDVKDPRLLKAATTAVRENKMTPLIKEELRYTILSRRSKMGMGEIVLEEKKRPVKKVMNEQEKERYLRRQEQNRRAAMKCRKKKKQGELKLLKAYYAEKDKYAELVDQIDSLKKEKLRLEESLKDHLDSCSCSLSIVAGSIPVAFQPLSSTHIPSSTATSKEQWSYSSKCTTASENVDSFCDMEEAIDIPDSHINQDVNSFPGHAKLEIFDQLQNVDQMSTPSKTIENTDVATSCGHSLFESQRGDVEISDTLLKKQIDALPIQETDVEGNLDLVMPFIGLPIPQVAFQQYLPTQGSSSDEPAFLMSDSSLDRLLDNLSPQAHARYDPHGFLDSIPQDNNPGGTLVATSQQHWETASYPDLTYIINEGDIRYQ